MRQRRAPCKSSRAPWRANWRRRCASTASCPASLPRTTTPQRRFVLKQSRPQLRTRDPWFSDLARIYREQEVMQALQQYLPGVVPQVLFVDRPNFVYAMNHAPLEAEVWKGKLLNGT